MADGFSGHLIGRLTRDPETKQTASGMCIAEFGMAWSTGKKDARKANFIDVTCFGRQAEVAGEYLKKGSPVYIEGEIEMDQWEDKQTGQRRSKHVFKARRFQMLGQGPGQASREQAQTAQAQQKSNDEIPF